MSEATLNRTAAEPAGLETAAGRLHGLLAEFASAEQLVDAARRVRAAGYTCWDAHSPFPIHGIDEAMGIRRTRLPWIVLFCGIVGALLALALQWWTNAADPLDWKAIPTFLQGYAYRVSGKPAFSLPANIPVIFEVCVLLASLAAAIGMLALNGLPRWHQPVLGHPRFRRATTDRFFICIEARDPKFVRLITAEFLESLGGGPSEVIIAPPAAPRPRWLLIGGMLVVCLALFPPLWAWYMTVTTKPEPRIHLIQDMDNQWKYKAQQVNPAFADARAMRPLIAGTIARTDAALLGDNPHFYEGKVAGDWATTFPPELQFSETLLRRGEQRFNVYCSVCHGMDGRGNGIVAKRARDKSEISTGWVPPSSLQDAIVVDRSVGHIFNTITNGIRTMPPYGDQIAPADRWVIVAYVRALERSQAASVEDVPEDQRADLR